VARADFPALHQSVHGRPLVWFDNAATTQKPRAVLDAMTRFYERDNSNVHRGAHTLAARATDAYEDARGSVARLVGASGPDEIVFVRGTTEGINLLAATLGRSRVGPGDEIVLTTLEHHANIVPWQLLAQSVGARLRPVPIDGSGQVQLDAYSALLNDRTKIVALSHVSNALGTVLPVKTMTAAAKARGIPVVSTGRRRSPTCLSTSAPWGLTSTSSPATRSSARRASARSTADGAPRVAPALAGRRQHDPRRHVRAHDLLRPADPLRGRHPVHRRRRRPRRCNPLRPRARHAGHRCA
jgi:hypothetical protein